MSDTEIEDFGVTVTTKLLVEFNKTTKQQPHATNTARTLMGLEAMSVLLERIKNDVRQGLG